MRRSILSRAFGLLPDTPLFCTTARRSIQPEPLVFRFPLFQRQLFSEKTTEKSGGVRREKLDHLTARLSTTPSRLFKLIVPISDIPQDFPGSGNEGAVRDKNTEEYVDLPDPDPRQLALLLHPNQPLSHMASLINSQLPPVKGRPPIVRFYRPTDTPPVIEEVGVPPEEEVIKSGGASKNDPRVPTSPDREMVDDESLVLWSGSTEIGDFVRDAAAATEEEEQGLKGGFVISIENRRGIWVSVPSFNDRTYYLQERYRNIAKQIEGQLELKEKCDALAQRSAQRVALTGFGALIGWWGVVYYLTFKTHYGWDVMEPVTYLVGLSTIAAGYLYFLYSKRNISYRSLLHATISRRQMVLYEAHGFDVDNWQELLDEGREVRRDIKRIAAEYGVRWDSSMNKEGKFQTKEEKLATKKVEKVLEKEEKKKSKKEKEEAKDDDDDESKPEEKKEKEKDD